MSQSLPLEVVVALVEEGPDLEADQGPTEDPEANHDLEANPNHAQGAGLQRRSLVVSPDRSRDPSRNRILNPAQNPFQSPAQDLDHVLDRNPDHDRTVTKTKEIDDC